MSALAVGQFVTFSSDSGMGGTIFEFQDEGMVAGLNNLTDKLKASGCGEQTHEPCENLVAASALRVGQTVWLVSDGKELYGTIFEWQDNGAVAGLNQLSDKLKGLGCGEETHEPVENLQPLK